MSRLPLASAKKVIGVLQKFGFKIHRQSGSHIHLLGSDGRTLVTVPNHPELAKGTLNSIIKQSKIDRRRFIEEL